MSEFATYEVYTALKLKTEVFWLFTTSSVVTETRRFERPSRITNVATERNNPEDLTPGISFPAYTRQQNKTRPYSLIAGKRFAYYWLPILALVNIYLCTASLFVSDHV